MSWTNIVFKLLSAVGKYGLNREFFWTNSSKMGLKEISCFYEGTCSKIMEFDESKKVQQIFALVNARTID